MLKTRFNKRFEEQMDDDSDDKDSKRKSRNLSEKKRRDQFNMLVNELSSMVSSGNRKMDKSTVLKSTISFLKNHNEVTVRSRVNEIEEDWKPTFLTNEEFIHLILEAVDGFIIIFSTSGQIYYTSEGIASLLGYSPKEISKTTIYQLISEDEYTNVYNILNPSQEDKQISFTCHLKRGGFETKTDESFEMVHFEGYFRPDENLLRNENVYGGETDTRLLFVGTGRIQTPLLIKEMPLTDSTKSEFTSRHSLEWKFLFLDHRAPPIIGYLPFELLGTSGYDYYHIDDLDNVVVCHVSLMEKGEGTSCFYRFLTKGQQWIWLQTRFYITYHQWNSKPEFIVCNHRVVSYTEMAKRNSEGESTNDEPSPWSVSSPTETSVVRHGSASDCTSMSADSPASRQSSHRKSQSNYVPQNPPHVVQPIQSEPIVHQHQIQPTQFTDPQHYLTAIPVQQLINNFPSPGILSPAPVDNIVMPNAQSQLQVDLQRKHAELQAVIGQQQQELRRVSEQLLMARLGILPGSQQVEPAISYQTSNQGIVSSTTTAIQGLPAIPGQASVIVPAVSLPLPLQQQTLIYSNPDSNTQTK
ncbi:circadian locomoter output cycles protein kaput isoform X1 [Diorhabda sublineata]|uniref:circadian locomoter output cycles protein kaput isoform X1 n=1 Tax=Diorhabda sublineata TaxID=1163346 RepID=UPI0024E146D3|nr:circadian locomoter output cycles protein kaput isoform X1 [Diorhabda sublineata]